MHQSTLHVCSGRSVCWWLQFDPSPCPRLWSCVCNRAQPEPWPCYYGICKRTGGLQCKKAVCCALVPLVPCPQRQPVAQLCVESTLWTEGGTHSSAQTLMHSCGSQRLGTLQSRLLTSPSVEGLNSVLAVLRVHSQPAAQGLQTVSLAWCPGGFMRRDSHSTLPLSDTISGVRAN